MSIPHRPGVSHARNLRKNQTDTERKLWSLLKSRGLSGYKFRRQRPIGPYIVDFCCLKPRLVIEADGGQHATRAGYDATRTLFIEKQVFQLLRFWDSEILSNPSTVMEVILTTLRTLTLPSPRRGEGKDK